MATGICLMQISMTLLNSPISKTPCLVPHFRFYYYCISQIFANVVFKKHNLVTVVTKVSLGQISTMPLNCPTPKSPFWCQHNPLIFCILAFCTWSSTLDALVSVANDFDVADIPNPGVWKWPSLGK